MNIDETIAFHETYTKLGKILDAAQQRDRAEMEAKGLRPVYLGCNYEGTPRNPEFTITGWGVMVAPSR